LRIEGRKEGRKEGRGWGGAEEFDLDYYEIVTDARQKII
jgi:hypothetical protein